MPPRTVAKKPSANTRGVKPEMKEPNLTPQQRHCWDRDVRAQRVPLQVVQAVGDIKQSNTPGKPAKIAELVSQWIPRDVEYRSQINWDQPALLRRFVEKYSKDEKRTVASGMSQSQCEAVMGGGDMVKGAANMKIAMVRKHLVRRGDQY